MVNESYSEAIKFLLMRQVKDNVIAKFIDFLEEAVAHRCIMIHKKIQQTVSG